MPYRRVARRAARRYGLDPRIFERQINQESGFNPNAVSPAGAVGIAQIMPATARGWGVDPRDPRAALDAAAKNMAAYVRKYGSYENALRAYNAGPGNIAASKGFSETNAYVQRILGGQDPGRLSKGRSGRSQRNLTLPGTSGARAVPQGSEGLVALLSQLAPQKAPVQSMGLAAPEFSAAPALPANYQGISSGGGPQRKPNIGALLSAIQTPGGDVAGPSATEPLSFPGAGGRVGGRAMRGGGSTTKALANSVAAYAQSLGLPAGSRERTPQHNAAVGGSPTSDHLTGPGHEAVDIPTTAQNGGWAQYRQVVNQLGLKPSPSGFTEGIIRRGGKRFRVQAIFGAANEHGDHIHVGFRRV